MQQGLKDIKDKKVQIKIFSAVIVLIIAVVVSLLLNHAAQKRAYPLRYQDIIEKYADDYALDPYLIAAVIKTESNYKADAESKVGARGLMQVMPSTAEWIAGKLKEDYGQVDLYDPETNIRYGCWYLEFLQERFGDDKTAILAAYNAGHGKVAEWLDDLSVSPNGILEEIPYPDAQQYVERVNHAFEKYKELYEME